MCTIDGVTFNDLKWDTEFFGINCAKVILHKPLASINWNELKNRFKDFQFISIYNRNSDPINAQLIGKETQAFLADVNVQFAKKLYKQCEPVNITIHQALRRNEQIIELAEFPFSKFTEDIELEKRGGEQVYRQWLINSFGKTDKHFALSKDAAGDINGYALYSYSNNTCVIELIAVSKAFSNKGVGTDLFRAVEYAGFKSGCLEIKVGTQMRNLGAVNFYHKVGCKQVECHQVYHLWNL